MKKEKRIHGDGSEATVKNQTESLAGQPARRAAGAGKWEFNPQEYKIVSLRECVPLKEKCLCDSPESAWAYWQLNIATMPIYNPEVECLVVILLDTRRRAKGHALIGIGTINAVLFQPREVFRAAVIGAASEIVLMHNHPSGDTSPSQGDLDGTATAEKAAKIMGIGLLDHIIVGAQGYTSLWKDGFIRYENKGGGGRVVKSPVKLPRAERDLAQAEKGGGR
ncbi:MAG TPA: JAB domain-containing protein [Candidatus Saccharimonadales bacterium]|nr:JAB domain-containing protein [Candidatus Saccharimonadales bacterium]